MNNLKSILNSCEKQFRKLLENQESKKLKEGCYVYELEADSTISSEYILLMHYLGKINLKLQDKISTYLLNKQNQSGGWPLFFDGETDLSATVKAIMR